MNVCHLILWQLMLIGIFAEQSQYGNITSDQLTNKFRFRRMAKQTELVLKVKIKNRSKIIHLVATEQLLANRNLPVWLSSSGKYQRLDNIMKGDYDDFTMYHDYITKSAVVYFHERHEIIGVVSMKYKIQIQSPNESDLLNKEYELNTKDLIKVSNYFDQLSQLSDDLVNENDATTPSSKLEIYPELFIAISHDMFQAIEKNSKLPMGVKTVSHVLIVYNIVDMMFTYVQSADISLHIAGIVIENSENEWGFSSQNVPSSPFHQINLNRKINNHFKQLDNIFRRESYDIIAYHTRNKIQTLRSVEVPGVSCCEHYKPMHHHREHYYRYNLAVQDFESFEHYPIIVQGLAHTLGANSNHMNNWFINQPCNKNTMMTLKNPSLCLKWSNEIEKKFQNYFESPAHCILRNKPSFEDSDKPRKTFTKTEQCQCYGYEAHNMYDNVLENECSEAIKCKYEEGGVVKNLPYPMDGTPCDRYSRKVCWKNKCVNLRPVC